MAKDYRYQWRKEQGLCPYCGRAPSPPEYVTCAPCRARITACAKRRGYYYTYKCARAPFSTKETV